MNVDSNVWNNAKVDWTLFWSNEKRKFNDTNKHTFNDSDFKNKDIEINKIDEEDKKMNYKIKLSDENDLISFKLRAHLSGGSNKSHAQLFRQKQGDNKNQLDVMFHFD